MGDVKGKIIEYIKKNRVSTTEIADCLGKKGCLEEVYALNRGLFCVGEIVYVYAVNQSNWTIHEGIRGELQNRIVFMDAIDAGNRAMVGELVSKYILLYQGATAIVTNGKMRDAHKLIKERYPVWCKGTTPVGTFNIETDITAFKEVISCNREFYEGAIMVCDDTGVVVIPKENITEEFYEKIEKIEEQEDIWFDCLDRKKWNTFDIVCKKKYLEDN